MITTVLSTTFSTISERWKAILGATVVATIALMIAIVLLVPMMMGVLTASMIGGGSSQGTSISGTGGATGGTMTMTINGETTTVPMQSGSTASSGTAFGSTKPAVEKPGMGAIMMVLVVGLVIMVMSIATATIGVFAATGSGVGDAIREGIRTSPHAFVQSLKVGWPALVSYVAALIAMIMVSPVIGIVLFLVSIVFFLRAGALATVAIGSIAHGHVSYSPELAREAVRGRMGSAIGANVVGSLVGGVIAWIPLAGPVFMSAFISAMWEEFGDGGAPRPGSSGSPLDGSDQRAPGIEAASSPATSAAPVAATTPIAVVPPAATPVAATLLAGPTWYLDASPAEPAGSWIQLGEPGRIALQIQWSTGEAPALQLADQAGTWRTPPQQPTQSGEATWLDLPAGYTWVAVVPRAARQQLWVSSMLPSIPGTGDAAIAA